MMKKKKRKNGCHKRTYTVCCPRKYSMCSKRDPNSQAESGVGAPWRNSTIAFGVLHSCWAQHPACCLPRATLVLGRPLAIPVVLTMAPHSLLRKLYELNRASPQFHQQLSSFFRGSEYLTVFPDLHGGNLAWLVEYLDNVSLQMVFLRAELNI